MDRLCSRSCAELGTVWFSAVLSCRALSMRACHSFSFPLSRSFRVMIKKRNRSVQAQRERVERRDRTTFFPRGLTNEDALPLNCGVRGFRAAH